MSKSTTGEEIVIKTRGVPTGSPWATWAGIDITVKAAKMVAKSSGGSVDASKLAKDGTSDAVGGPGDPAIEAGEVSIGMKISGEWPDVTWVSSKKSSSLSGDSKDSIKNPLSVGSKE